MNKKIMLIAAALFLSGCTAKAETKDPNNYTSEKTATPTQIIETAEPKENDTDSNEDVGYKFEYGKQEISVNEDVDTLLASLGEAKKKTSYKSVAFTGKEHVYEYDGIKIATYPGDTKDYIESIMITDKSITTEEGIKVGDSAKKLKQAYKDTLSEGKNGIMEATSGDTMIRFIVMDKKVAAIDYYAVIKNKAYKKDNEAPKIVNPFEMTFYTDQKEEDIDYYRYTTAKDVVDANARVVIDTSNVDLSKCGNYKVTIYAYDRAGNVASEKTTYTVAEKQAGYTDPEKVDSRADAILETIITDDMSTTDKCTAIYKWIRGNFNFVDTSDKTDWVQAASNGLKRRSGDCFVYYAVAQELLYRSGVESMRVQKNPGHSSTHYWSLVYVPDQGWYHFDTTPRKSGGEFDLVTDQWLLNYSAKHGNSHDFDTNKYPATSKKTVKK